jgi:tight adherence protein C
LTPQLLIAVVGVFIVVAAGAATATSWWLARTAPEQRRLRTMTQPSGTGLIVPAAALTESPDPFLASLSKWVPKSPKEMSKLQRRLTRAGYRTRAAVIYYSLAEIALPLGLAAAAILSFGRVSGLLPAAFLAVIGYVAPSFYIGHKVKVRQKLIRNGLPDALDLLTVCTEAGSGLDQAISKASEELQTAHPVLAEELRLIITEVRAGKPRMEAFKNFAARTGVDDVKSLVSMLLQTDRFGTSVADALRIQSDTSRTKRRQAAEERAQKVGVKLVFPLVLCLFPALYVVCFGPVVVKIYRALIESVVR